MEGLREIATNCYKEKWSVKEINEANEFFWKLDSNEDGIVSVKELRESGIISDQSYFRFNNFDINDDKVLDFEEILTLYFYKYKANLILHNYKPRYWRYFKCNGCGCKQAMPDYSCFFCLGKSPDQTYNLCNKCYNTGAAECDLEHGHNKLCLLNQESDLKHEHEKWCLLNQESLGLLKEIHYILNEVDNKKGEEKVGKVVSSIGATASGIGTAMSDIGTTVSNVAFFVPACTIM